jgi:hypothetical protein
MHTRPLALLVGLAAAAAALPAAAHATDHPVCEVPTLAAESRAAPAVGDCGDLPDAGVFATDNTATITDPADPRLDKRLVGFARRSTELIRGGGGMPLGSQLLDGVFFSSDSGTVTFERSRGFDVDDVSTEELAGLADAIRRRFRQQSVLTFDYLPRGAPGVDAVEVEVPGVDVARFRDALVADRATAERLVGGSVTLDGRLLLVVELADLGLAQDVAEAAGGDWDAGLLRFGDREFVG